MKFQKLKNAAFKDYEIRSGQLQGYVIYFSFGLHLVIFISNLILDYDLISTQTILPVLLASFFIVLAYRSGISPLVLAYLNLILFYLSFEIHFLLTPQIFYFIIYWFSFLVIIAVVSGGVKQSLIWLGIVFSTIVFNYLYLANVIIQQNEYHITVNIMKTAVGGILFLGGIFLFICLFYWLLGNAYFSMKEKSDELQELRNASEQKRIKLEKYQKAHLSMSGDLSLINGKFENLYRKICQLAYDNMEVSRVSIWIFDHSSSALCRKYFYSQTEENDKTVTINLQDFPAYFRAVTVKRFIAAESAQEHPDTSEFKESYLQPHQIYSLLDSPFLVDGELKGIICCENQYTHRQWTSADILFIQSLSDFISLSYKSQESQALLLQIISQNNELLEQRHEIEAMNEKLSMMNETLELKVRERTQGLENQNQLLTEYAFINSHQLRAPLSRILGLSYLITNRLKEKTDADLLNALIDSTNELDLIVNRISKLLYDGDKLCRDDIRTIIGEKLKK